MLQAMEHEALTEPHYLPLRVGKDGNLSGSLASAARLGKLGTYVDKLLGQISDELRSGNIDAGSLLPQRGGQPVPLLRLGLRLSVPGWPGSGSSAVHPAGKTGGILERT